MTPCCYSCLVRDVCLYLFVSIFNLIISKFPQNGNKKSDLFPKAAFYMNKMLKKFLGCHCEERSPEAISNSFNSLRLDYFFIFDFSILSFLINPLTANDVSQVLSSLLIFELLFHIRLLYNIQLLLNNTVS